MPRLKDFESYMLNKKQEKFRAALKVFQQLQDNINKDLNGYGNEIDLAWKIKGKKLIIGKRYECGFVYGFAFYAEGSKKKDYTFNDEWLGYTDFLEFKELLSQWIDALKYIAKIIRYFAREEKQHGNVRTN